MIEETCRLLKWSGALLWLFAVSVQVSHGGEWRHDSAMAGAQLPGDDIQFITEGANKRIWIGALGGLAYYENDKYQLFSGENGKPFKRSAWTVVEVPKGVWIGHGGGASYVSGKRWHHVLPGHSVAAIMPIGGGACWAIAKELRSEVNRLYQLVDGKAQLVQFFKSQKVVDLVRLGDELWLTIDGNGVFQIDPTASIESAKHHLKGVNVTCVTRAKNGQVWCGLWGLGVTVFDGESWTKHLPKQRGAILRVVEDSRGTIWVATSDNGLWRYEGGKWQSDLADEGSVNLLEATSDGRVWVSTQATGGLRVWKDAAWQEILPGPLPIRCLFEADGGEIWAGGVLDGIHRLAP